MADEDVTARRRAVALAGHLGDEPTARAGLDDRAAIVRATALGALARLSTLTLVDVERAVTDPDAVVRCRVAEVTPRALQPADANRVLQRLLRDADDRVVEVAAWACGEAEGSGAEIVGLLATITTGHDEALVREAAVAALGAIGDEAGLPAILSATTDRPAIRRRAVLALAPFEGPEVDAALQRALEDRDWQVRQAAQDLLD
jgi:HEAT repeat protein